MEKLSRYESIQTTIESLIPPRTVSAGKVVWDTLFAFDRCGLLWFVAPMLAASPPLRFIYRLSAPALCLALVFYFGFHAAYGERGLLSLRMVQAETEMTRNALAEASARKAAIERRVGLIKAPAIDGDILEEEVRKLLGWSAADEIVIILDRNN